MHIWESYEIWWLFGYIFLGKEPKLGKIQESVGWYHDDNVFGPEMLTV